MKTLENSSLHLTPQKALELLKKGNDRFIGNELSAKDFALQIYKSKTAQSPFAVILGCIDSRVPHEVIFDQGFGDIFSVRVAGNIVNEDVLGSIEYSCKVVGSKLIMVLGHTKCGAITAACNDFEMGNITKLLNKIKPLTKDIDSNNVKDEEVEKVCSDNVLHSMDLIRQESPIIAEMEKNNEIIIVGAKYDVSTGKVTIIG